MCGCGRLYLTLNSDMCALCVLSFFSSKTDKQRIENETKVQTQRDSTIDVLEEQLHLCSAKVRLTARSSFMINEIHTQENLIKAQCDLFLCFFGFYPVRSCFFAHLLFFR